MIPDKNFTVHHTEYCLLGMSGKISRIYTYARIYDCLPVIHAHAWVAKSFAEPALFVMLKTLSLVVKHVMAAHPPRN